MSENGKALNKEGQQLASRTGAGSRSKGQTHHVDAEMQDCCVSFIITDQGGETSVHLDIIYPDQVTSVSSPFLDNQMETWSDSIMQDQQA